jgi:hypothetical protein
MGRSPLRDQSRVGCSSGSGERQSERSLSDVSCPPAAGRPPWTESPRERQAQALAGGRVPANARADHTPISWAEIVGHAVRIDRTGPLGNPFRLRDPNDERERAEVIARCAAEHFPKAADLARDPCPPGSVLICWCYDKKCHAPCHGDVIINHLERKAYEDDSATRHG